jgi:hypothetical protein
MTSAVNPTLKMPPGELEGAERLVERRSSLPGNCKHGFSAKHCPDCRDEHRIGAERFHLILELSKEEVDALGLVIRQQRVTFNSGTGLEEGSCYNGPGIVKSSGPAFTGGEMYAINIALHHERERFWHERTREPEIRVKDKSGFVYFLGGPTSVKIGCSTHPDIRTHQIGTKLPFKTKLLACIAVSDRYAAEKFYHKRFAAFRLEGEWFALSPEVLLDTPRWPTEEPIAARNAP